MSGKSLAGVRTCVAALIVCAAGYQAQAQQPTIELIPIEKNVKYATPVGGECAISS